MPVEYTNYKGDKYFLHEYVTKKGGKKYTFSKSIDGNLPDRIPDGFEIYENPSGQVYLRLVKPKHFTDNEIQTIKNSIPKGLNAKIDLREKALVIYISQHSWGLYSAMMRFVLTDEKCRMFRADRYCFRGAIDDWIELDESTDLKKLAEKCCIHLGEDTFYDLPYDVPGFSDYR